ncbi:MAG: prolyl oligopeptidase family serine peptidase [Fimbriimonadaceae bacterium]|nr:prolyl oligopeptidase family serine peptidase [Fimbriimonadaceae bacterium]
MFAVSLFAGIAMAVSLSQAPERYAPVKDTQKPPRQPYLRYFTQDKFDRKITFYLSENPGGKKLPLAVYVQGSGCQSCFVMQGEAVVPAGGHIVVNEIAVDKARALIIEKPGVKYLDDPKEGGARGASKEFLEQHTLDRWAEAVEAAIKAAHKLPDIDASKLLVIGHSEGGLVAARVAKDLRASHVAVMAGGGPSQLFDILSRAREGVFFNDDGSTPESREAYVLDEWKSIQADPMSTEKFFFGHPNRRWSTFLASSPIAELSDYKGKVFIAQGAEDKGVDPKSAEVLFAALLAKGVNVKLDVVANANHSFRILNDPKIDGWKLELQKILDWYLQSVM